MRVALINPPSPFLLDDRVFPPLGLLQVAAVLEEAGHYVEVCDLGGVSEYKEEMAKFVAGGWDVYGVTATTPQFPMAIGVLHVIRECDPGKRVIIGGPHPTVMPESCHMFDCVVRGDGEAVILDAILPECGKELDEATNTIKGELNYHVPARHLIDLGSYRYSLKGISGTSAMASTGCSYNCHFCSIYSTLVLTDLGALPIGEVVGGKANFVWTREGLRRIEQRFEHAYKGNIVCVRVAGRGDIEVTPNHEFLTRRGWLPASDLVVGDEVRLSVPDDTKVEDIQSIDLLDLLKDVRVTSKLGGKYTKCDINEIQRLIGLGLSDNKISETTGAKRSTVARIRSSEYFVRSHSSSIQETLGRIYFKGSKKLTPRYLFLDHKFMRLAGLFVAEGHTNFIKARPNSGVVGLTFGRHESQLVQETLDLISAVFGEAVSLSELESTYHLYIGNSVLAHAFSILFGKGASNKKIPWDWLFLPKDLILSFLMGYLAGDGSYCEDKSHGKGRWRSSTVSSTLAYQLQLIYARLGKASGVYKKSGSGGKQEILGRIVNAAQAYSVEMSGKLEISPARLWAPITDISVKEFEGLVYNLKIADLPNYSVVGIDVHNCCGRSIPFYRRVRTRNLDSFVSEMQHLKSEYGIGAVTLFDDEINLDDKYVNKMALALVPLNMKFRAFIKANLFSERQAEVLAKAGFVELCTGVEAAHPKILKVIEKRTTPEINKRFVDLCHSFGIRAKCFTSIGHAGDSIETVMALKDWLLWAKPDDFDVTCITIYPACPYWDEREFIGLNSEGKRICRFVKRSRDPEINGATLYFEEVDYANDAAYYKGVPGSYSSFVWTPDLSKEDLVRLRDKVEDDVRKELGIPYPKRFSGDYLAGAENFEHSYGMGASPQDSRVLLKSDVESPQNPKP